MFTGRRFAPHRIDHLGGKRTEFRFTGPPLPFVFDAARRGIARASQQAIDRIRMESHVAKARLPVAFSINEALVRLDEHEAHGTFDRSPRAKFGR